eukprot:scaffold1313_cov349-Pavlova_lutheri.AAC.9
MQISCETVAQELRRRGHEAQVIQVKPAKEDHLRSWYHTYVVVRKKGGRETVVDPNFLAQFQVARPTRAFQGVVDRLPPEFVGRIDKLLVVARFLADRAMASLQESGLNVPPWRQRDAILLKWAPTPKASVARFGKST